MKKNLISKRLQFTSYNSKGITLIALVITIVILLILAGITITTLLGENGIIKKAQEAANKVNEAVENELLSIDELINELNGNIGENTGNNENAGDTDYIEDIEKIGAYPAPEPELDYTVNEGEIVAKIYIPDGDDLTYTSLGDAIADSFEGDLIYLVCNYELQEDIVIPTNVTLLIPSTEAYDDTIQTVPILGGENATEAYVALKSNHTITVNGTLLVGGSKRIGEGGGQGLVSGAYGQVILGTTGNIVVNAGGKLYANGYITGTGNITVELGGEVHQLYQAMDWMIIYDGSNRSTGSPVISNVYMTKDYYIQNIMVNTVYNYGSRLYANYASLRCSATNR